jgi:glutamate carboxypeptidase
VIVPEPLTVWQARLPGLLADIEELIRCESPTDDVAAGIQCAQAVDALGTRLLGAKAEQLTDAAGRVQLRWRFGAGDKVLLLGHYDTVWPIGSLATHPFAVTAEGRLTGPGCFDMKTGLVQLFHALSGLDDLDGVTVLVNGDEETGSIGSAGLIEAEARRVRAALVLEASERGALKTARKGVAMYDVGIAGRAAHAGLEPHRGVNASVELAHQILAIIAIGDAGAEAGTTVTPTVASSGTTRNTVPDLARLLVDVRVASAAEQDRVNAALRALTPVLAEAAVQVVEGPRRAPMSESSSAGLFARARRLHAGLGLGELRGVAVGGGSDGNLTAGVGTPTLDGLGAVGGGAHADDDHVRVEEIPRRTALLAALVAELLDEERQE